MDLVKELDEDTALALVRYIIFEGKVVYTTSLGWLFRFSLRMQDGM